MDKLSEDLCLKIFWFLDQQNLATAQQGQFNLVDFLFRYVVSVELLRRSELGTLNSAISCPWFSFPYPQVLDICLIFIWYNGQITLN